MGTKIPLPLFAAGTTFVAAEVCALINDYLFPHIPVINVWQAPAHTALNVGTLAAGTALLENQLAPGLLQQMGMTEVAALSLLAEISSTYLVDDLILPMMDKWSA
ncbi:MAG: hypothetical protein P4L87_13600 [Formivibrio sp.]|nr:hypothetical protein [Formivibrio sp.]